MTRYGCNLGQLSTYCRSRSGMSSVDKQLEAVNMASQCRYQRKTLTLRSVWFPAADVASCAADQAVVAACTTVWQPSAFGANKWFETHCISGPARFQILDLTAPGSTAHDCISESMSSFVLPNQGLPCLSDDACSRVCST